MSNGQSMCSPQQSSEREGFPLAWAWGVIQKPGNAA